MSVTNTDRFEEQALYQDHGKALESLREEF